MSFGEYLKKLIEEKGYSYRKVAMLSGVDHTYISRLARNKKERPSPEILAKLAPPLGTTYEDMMRAAGYLPPKTCEKQKSPLESSENILGMGIIPLVKNISEVSPFFARDKRGRYVTIPKKFLCDGDFLWRVKGTSLLEAGIEEGDYIVIKQQPVTKIGEIIFIQDGKNLVLKKVNTYQDLISYQTGDTKSKSIKNIGTVISSHRIHVSNNE